MAIYGTQELIDAKKGKQIMDSKNRTIIFRGARLEYDINPHVPTENMVDKADIVQTLTTTSDTLCQVFRASSNNVHDISLTLQGAGTQDDLDTFEGYADSAALKAEWVASDETNTFVELDEAFSYSGDNSMRVQCRKNQSPGDTITKDYGSGQDFTGYESLTFQIFNQVDLTCIWKINIIDTSANTAEIQYNQPSNIWTLQELVFSNFTNFTGVDWTNIRYIEFEMVECSSALHNYWVDEMRLNGPAGTIDVELVDFGSSAPISDDDITVEGSVLTLDEAVSSVTIPLSLSKSTEVVHLHHGSHNYANEMTVGNYYGVHIKNPSSGECFIYGSATQKYESGGAFSVNGSDIMSDLSKTIYFSIECIAPAYLHTLHIQTNGAAGSSKTFICVIDRETNKCQDEVLRHFHANDTELLTQFLKEETPLFYCDRRYYITVRYEDASDSSAETISIHAYFIYEPVEVYG